jgi:hypothetical protein
MGWGLVQQDNGQTLRIVLTKLLQKEGEAVGIAAGPLPPEGVAGGGCDCRLQPGRLVQRFDALEGLHAVACAPTVEGHVQAQTTCILAADPHGLVGGWPPSGGAGAEATWALLHKIRRGGDVFFAWLGRGRCSFALS